MIRKILVTVVGHVDHGKSSLLDHIRGTQVAAREAGAITQAIGASIIPIETVKSICGQLLTRVKLAIPGILAIDTPGHAAFTNLRKRGGSLADIAIVVVDINEGFMPQTTEAIEILKSSKTPFVIAANKIDLIPGWKASRKPVGLGEQDPASLAALDERLYLLVGTLYEAFGMNAERFDRVEDYTTTVAIVPVSAKTGQGIPELLMVIMGMAGKYLESSLRVNVAGPAKGTILEVKEEKGLGVALDVIIYDGTLRVNDTIVIGGLTRPIITKVKALFEPEPLTEMREKKTRFLPVKQASAAAGVRISAKGIEEAVSGMPLEAAPSAHEIERVTASVQSQVESVLIETDQSGMVIKADALGSLEAMITLLKEAGIPIKRASIGPITKKDILDAEASRTQDPLLGVVMGFNVRLGSGVEPGNVTVITNDVIYKLLEEYDTWKKAQQQAATAHEMEQLTRPFKLELLRGYVFRQSNPAVAGVEVQAGILTTNVQVMKSDGKPFSVIKSIQLEKEQVAAAEKGQRVAISLPHVIIGRNLKEGDILYSYIDEATFRKLKDHKDDLQPGERDVLKEIAVIMRKENPVWGV